MQQITVSTFDEEKAKKLLNECPVHIQEYVKLLKNGNKRKMDIIQKQNAKIKELSKQI